MSSILNIVKYINLSTFTFGSSIKLNYIAKATIKSGIKRYKNIQETLAKIGEMLEDLVAEINRKTMTSAQTVKVYVKTTEK